MLTNRQVAEICDHVLNFVPDFDRELLVEAIREYEENGTEGKNRIGIVGVYLGSCVEKVRRGESLK